MIIEASGDVLACGQNNEGQLGVGDDHIRQTPEDVLKLDKVKVVALAGGAEHSAALTGEKLRSKFLLSLSHFNTFSQRNSLSLG